MLLSSRFKIDSKPHLNLSKKQKEYLSDFSKILEKNKDKNFEKLNCLICNNSDFEIISEKDRYGLYYPTGICSGCGNMQQTEYFSDEILNIFYRDYYNKIYSYYNDVELRFNSQHKLAFDKYSFLKEFVDKSKNKKNLKILEIGCGPGGIVSFFSEKGYDVTGIDLDDKHLEFGKKKNLNLINRNHFNLEQKYDLILMSHVLEHLKKPEKELDFIKKICHQHSIIYIEVPSISMIGNMYDSDVLKYLHIAHCYHFSLKSFENFCLRFGLKILKKNSKIQTICSLKEKGANLNYNYVETKKELEKFEKIFLRYGKILIFKRVIRRFVGKILNYFGIKFLILKLFEKK